MSDPFELQHFVDAQDAVWPRVLAELRAGRKRSHWMWFVFPQVAGLGTSAMSRDYAIRSLGEARAYLAHPVLGPRLRECVGILLALETSDPRAILGSPDDAKLRSSLTLFREAAPGEPLFQAGLDRFFEGVADPHTLSRL